MSKLVWYPQRVRIRTTKGRYWVHGFRALGSALAVTQNCYPDPEGNIHPWIISHTRSGRRLGSIGAAVPQELMPVVARLLRAGNWKRSEQAIKRDSKLMMRVRRVHREITGKDA